MSFMILQVFMQAAVLCGILYAIAKYEADYSFQKVAMVAAGIALGNVLITALLQERIKPDLHWVLVFPCIAFTAVMIMTFCWVSLWKSVLVVVIFVLFQTASDFARNMIMTRLSASLNAPASEALKKKEDDLKEFQMEILATMGGNNASRQPVIAKPEHPSSPVVTNVINKQAESVPIIIEKKKVVMELKDDSVAWTQAKKKLRVAGISRKGNEFVALVNNKVLVKGGVISIQHEDMVYRWQASEITKNGVIWKQLTSRPVNKSVSVPRR